MKMGMIPYLVHLCDAPIFQCGVPNFNSFTMKLGKYLHIHLLYRAQWLDFKFDMNKSVYLMKLIVIPYLVHLGDAHIFQCGVPNFISFTMKLGKYLHIHLLYRAQRLDFECDANENRSVGDQGKAIHNTNFVCAGMTVYKWLWFQFGHSTFYTFSRHDYKIFW